MAFTYSARLGVASPLCSRDTAQEKPLGRLEGLEGLPVEILLEIYQHLDVESVYLLSQVTTLFYGLFVKNKPQILLPVLEKEFDPFSELLQLYTASSEDLETRGATFQPRRIIYRRYPGDSTGIVLCAGGMPMSLVTTPIAGGQQNGFISIQGSGKPSTAAPLPAPRSVSLTERDLPSLLRCCRVIRKWEEIYPQLHWHTDPENCRQLTREENKKLRRALFRWWLHATYFHGDFPRPRRGEPEPFVHDIRTSQMRMYPTTELMEMRSMLVAVKNLVRHYIFPNLEQKLYEIESTPLEKIIEMSIRERVVDTYAKLDPKELMFYFENLYSYPRRRLVTDVNIRHPTFSHDRESLLAAVQSAVDERPWLMEIDNLEEVGSIVGRVCTLDGRLSNDESHDASVPAPGVLRRPRGEWSPPGDDGRALAERETSWWSDCQ